MDMRRHILSPEDVERCRDEIICKDHLIACGPTATGGHKRLCYNPRGPLFTIIADGKTQTSDNSSRAAMLYSEI